MKAPLAAVVLLHLSVAAFAQQSTTTEMEARFKEIQRKTDSVMNSPHYKDMMKRGSSVNTDSMIRSAMSRTRYQRRQTTPKRHPHSWSPPHQTPATVGDKWVFAANGRFASASAAQRYYSVSSNEAISVTDAWFGDGAWSLNGNAVVLTKDNDKANPRRGWMRLEEESYDNGVTWKEKLYLLRTSTVDGKEYEMGYHRDK